MPKDLRRAAFFLVAVCALSVAAVACSDDDTSSSTLEVSVQLTSQDSTLHLVGPDDQTVYGWNLLTGKSQVNGESADVELLGNVDYLNGSGDFFGFVTITFADGSSLGLRMTDGHAEAATDTTNATFTSGLNLLGGTGRYLEATGIGSFDGSRSEALGGAVEAVFSLKLSLR